MKTQIVTALVIISLALGVGCQTGVVVTDSARATLQSTAIPPASTITATFTPTGTPTEAPIESLTSEQRMSISVEKVERLNAARGINVITDTYMGQQYILNPDTLELEVAPPSMDEVTQKKYTMEIFLPVTKDGEGNLQIIVDGKPVTIPNSANVDFNMVVTDPHDPRIQWPTTEKGYFPGYPDLTRLQRMFVSRNEPGFTSDMIPVILLDKKVGEIALESGNAFRKTPFLKIATISPDGSFARISLLAEAGGMVIYEEGSDLEIDSRSGIREHREFWNTLEENSLYYLALPNQINVLETSIFASTNNLTGLAPVSENAAVLTGEKKLEDNKDMMLVFSYALIKDK